MSNRTQINFDGQTCFKVLRNESLTIPSVVSSPSPTGRSSGVYPTDTFDAKRNVVGGMLYAGFSDAAGPTNPDDIHVKLEPGDVVACSNADPSVVTVNGVKVGSIANTAVAGVLGFYG